MGETENVLTCTMHRTTYLRQFKKKRPCSNTTLVVLTVLLLYCDTLVGKINGIRARYRNSSSRATPATELRFRKQRSLRASYLR